MKRFFPAFLAVVLLLTLSACGKKEDAAETPPEVPMEEIQPPVEVLPPTPEELAEAAIESLLSSMTPEEKVGQLFFVRVPAENAVEDVAAYHLGGYILFGRDTKNKTANELIQTIQSYQDTADIPLLIGVDEEGGSVVRVSSNPHIRSEKFASPQRLFSLGGLEKIVENTREKDLLLKALGFNVNLAPVADVSTHSNDFIYSRTFGQDAGSVHFAGSEDQLISQFLLV